MKACVPQPLPMHSEQPKLRCGAGITCFPGVTRQLLMVSRHGSGLHGAQEMLLAPSETPGRNPYPFAAPFLHSEEARDGDQQCLSLCSHYLSSRKPSCQIRGVGLAPAVRQNHIREAGNCSLSCKAQRGESPTPCSSKAVQTRLLSHSKTKQKQSQAGHHTSRDINFFPTGLLFIPRSWKLKSRPHYPSC